MKKILPIILVVGIIISVLFSYKILVQKNIFVEENNTNNVNNGNEESAQIANPASVNCLKVGGTLKIEKNGTGAEYGLCYFEDNRACEEWAMLRGDCPFGGARTTGYDTIDQNYCAWSGGQTYAMKNSICILKNGSKCSTLDFYNGKNCDEKKSPDPVLCTMDAKQCPDGSYVGRSGPKCEFACPK